MLNLVISDGDQFELNPWDRISWYDDEWIRVPAHRNIVLLKRAWVIRWKNASKGRLIEMANMIIAIWLSVLKAITFLKSCSQLAEIPENSIVIEAIMRIIEFEGGIGYGRIRINKNVPAVTRVDEWTNAEMGVGAAIAAGNHALNGSWALLVIAAMVRRMIVIIENSLDRCMSRILFEREIPIAKIIRISPMRLDRIVIAPDFLAFLFI